MSPRFFRVERQPNRPAGGIAPALLPPRRRECQRRDKFPGNWENRGGEVGNDAEPVEIGWFGLRSSKPAGNSRKPSREVRKADQGSRCGDQGYATCLNGGSISF